MGHWPQLGDSFFNAGSNWEAEALLDDHGDWIVAYAGSFKNAADIVVLSVEQKQTSADSVGFAVVSLYRHYVELILKGLIRLGWMLRLRSSDFSKEHHRIADLWKECRPLLEKAFPEGDKADTDVVENCIKELAKIDSNGQATRFGETKHGERTLTERTQLSLTNMRDVMDRVASFLDGSYDLMDEIIQHQADVDADNAP